MEVKYVVVSGNPFNGLTIFGPFDSAEEAEESGEFNDCSDAWIVPVHKSE